MPLNPAVPPRDSSDVQQLGLLIDAISDYAIHMLDADGIVASWNSGAQRTTGYRADEIIGEHFSRFFTAEDQAAGIPAQILNEAARAGSSEGDGWRVRKDGSRFWATALVQPVHEPGGRLVGFGQITRDISERMAAQDALLESERRFRLLVESVIDYAIYMLDPSGIIINWNPGAERLKGYAAQEIVGQHFSRFYTDTDRSAGLPARALRTAAEQGRFETEGWRVRKDGSLFWANVVIDTSRDESGKLVGFAKITRDMTQQRE